MATLSFRRAYHESVPLASRVDHHRYGPWPLYVELSPYLLPRDFAGVHLVHNEGQPVVALTLTDEGRRKFNEVALANSIAKELKDFVGLFLYFSDVRSDHMMMAYSPIPNTECLINGLTEHEAKAIADSLG